MKTTLALFLLSLIAAVAGPTNAPTCCQLGWQAPLPPTVATNYTVHAGTISGYYTIHQSVGTNLTASVPGLTRGVRYYFAVHCTDDHGVNSAYSSEISWTPPLPSPPFNVMIKD